VDLDMDVEKTESEDTTTRTLISSSETQVSSSYTTPRYSRILVPHDGSEMSDKALSHAVYLSKKTGAEIVILHVVEHAHKIGSTALLATSKEAKGGKDIEKQDFEIRVEGEAKQMIEQMMRFCKQAGVKSQVSYRIQTGKPIDEIIKLAEDLNVDLIVVASSKNPSLVRRLLGSTSKKIIDSVEKPVLIVHG
jgi:nucleotide-binding universal stress UspA family protein